MTSIIYKINNNDRIISISSETWNKFAIDNQGNHILEENVLHREIWDFITDMETAEIYRIVVDKVRITNKPVKLPFRCDSPEYRRLFTMEISRPEKNIILFDSKIERIEERQPVKLFEHRINKSDNFLKVCSWCKKVEIDPQKEWVEVEDAVINLNLHKIQILPQITHAICPKCHEKIMKDLAN